MSLTPAKQNKSFDPVPAGKNLHYPREIYIHMELDYFSISGVPIWAFGIPAVILLAWTLYDWRH